MRVIDTGIEVDVYDITVEDNHNFYANDLLVHNCEIFTPSHAFDSSNPEIGCCILSNINLGFAGLDDYKDCARFLVNFLDTMIDISEWDIPAVKYAATKRRTLGIGISNLFGFLASSRMFYNQEHTRKTISKHMEHIYYELLTASNELAQQKGACELFKDTKYNDGWLAFDNKDVELTLDWDSLRHKIAKYGLRNSTLMAVPPAASSSVVSNSTAGVEPPRGLVTTKVDKHSTIKQLVPFYNYKDWYTTAWAMDFNNIDYIKLVACIQNFVDQGISLNLYYNTLGKKQIDIEQIISELVLSFNLGIKTWYYANFRTSDDADGIQGCSSGGCSV